MKSQALTHPKTLRLAKLLKLERWGAVGILEMLWQFAATHAPDGNLSRFDAIDLAEAVFWRGDENALLEALVSAGFIDRPGCCNLHKLLIHDWGDHLQDNVRRRLQRANQAVDLRCDDPRRTDNTRPASVMEPASDIPPTGDCTDGARAPSVQRRPTETETPPKPEPEPDPTPPHQAEPDLTEPPGITARKRAQGHNGTAASSASVNGGGGSSSASDFGGRKIDPKARAAALLPALVEALKLPTREQIENGKGDAIQLESDITDLRQNIIPAIVASRNVDDNEAIVQAKESTLKGKAPVAVFRHRLKKLFGLEIGRKGRPATTAA